MANFWHPDVGVIQQWNIVCGLLLKVFRLFFECDCSLFTQSLHRNCLMEGIMELLSGCKFSPYISTGLSSSVVDPQRHTSAPYTHSFAFSVDLIYEYVTDNCVYFIFCLHH